VLEIVKLWSEKAVLVSSSKQQVAFVYLCNDIIQRVAAARYERESLSMDQLPAIKQAFKEVIHDVFKKLAQKGNPLTLQSIMKTLEALKKR